MLVRRAASSDATAVAEVGTYIQRLHFEAFPEIFKEPDASNSVGYFAEKIDAQDATMLVAENDSGRIVGYAYALIEEASFDPIQYPVRKMQVHYLAVAEDCQGQGFGTALINAVKDLARSSDVGEIRLRVWPFNERAISFYERHGFNTTRFEMTHRI